MKCLWIWAGSLSMPSSSCVLLLLNVDIVVVFAVAVLPLQSVCRSPCNSIHKQNFNFIAHSSWHSQQSALRNNLQESLLVWRRCQMGVGIGQFECPCQSLWVLTNDYHRPQNGSISSHGPPFDDAAVGGVLPKVYWLALHSFDSETARSVQLVRIFGIRLLNLLEKLLLIAAYYSAYLDILCWDLPTCCLSYNFPGKESKQYLKCVLD